MIKGSVVITGGGTGGHLNVADSFIDSLHKKAISVIFIGSSNGQDQAWFKNDKRLKEAYFLDTKGVLNKTFFGKIKSLFNIFLEIKTCLNIYSKHNVKAVICVGGYSAASGTFASILSASCSLYIHEQNSKMGKLNKISSPFAKEVFSSYDSKSLVKDYPVSKLFFDNSRIRKKIKTIIFLGGSQGAMHINNFALELAISLNNLNINIIHQTGSLDFERVKKIYDKLNIKVDIFAFSNEIYKKMNKADFAVSRSGASTLWELCANTLPALFIPYPYATSDHQYYNAKFLQDQGLCYLLRQNELNKDFLLKILKKDNFKISKNLFSCINTNGVDSIIDILIENHK